MPAGKSVNVRVAVRARPFSQRDADHGASEVTLVDEGANTVELAASDTVEARTFTFDHAYGAAAKQQTIYEDVGRPMMEAAFEGYNATVFAYGQTGSGKTHTMMGAGGAADEIKVQGANGGASEMPAEAGIIPRLNAELFATVDARRSDDLKFLVTVSFLEIYNEVVKDLLNPSDRQLKIRESPQVGIYVQDLAELVVRTAADVAKLLEQGNRVRAVAATQMNERSSRSHSCFTIRVQQKRQEQRGKIMKEIAMNAKINLVDLAGCERASKTGATGGRLKEGAAINKSLSALGTVINSLAEGAEHVAYRDSKLTRLLQESLGGNAQCTMVANVSAASFNADETRSTLLYANRAKSIKNETKRNEDVNESVIRDMRAEIEALRAQLAASGGAGSGGGAGGAGGGGGHGSTEGMEEMIAALERSKHESWEEKERLAKLYEEERTRNLGNSNHIAAAMQTLQQEKLQVIEHIKELQQRRMKLGKKLRAAKAEGASVKSELEGDMASYQQLLERADAAKGGGGEDEGELDAALQQLLPTIETRRGRLLRAKRATTGLKDEVRAVDAQLAEARAQIAAQTALLEEDDAMRERVREEERAKMGVERAALLGSALAEEREALAAQGVEAARVAREGALSTFAGMAARENEAAAQMELELMQLRADNGLLRKQLSLEKGRGADARRAAREAEERGVAALRDVFAAAEEERARSAALLQSAMQDVMMLSKRSASLERELAKAIAYEPS
jgi:kinesin family protein 1/kinesin family protein 3/17